MGHWTDKVVLVTGGSAGLGRAIADGFAAAGARVVIAARDGQRARRVAEELSAGGRSVAAGVCDVTDPGQVDELIAEVVRQQGRLDVLVNNVGKSDRGEILRTPIETLREAWEGNFLSAVVCTQAAAPHLIETGGMVINIGSLAAKTASPHMGSYPTAKFPLDAFSQQLRFELEPRGVGVLLVCPGPIRRDDAGQRYAARAGGLPSEAALPGGGVKLKALDPRDVTRRILRAAERRRAELILPGHARLLFALGRLFPRWADWIVLRRTRARQRTGESGSEAAS